jgi:hypothetical protein
MTRLGRPGNRGLIRGEDRNFSLQSAQTGCSADVKNAWGYVSTSHN